MLSLPPGLNCSNNKSLLPKYEILEPVTSKILLKTRYWTFLVAYYFMWHLKFFSNFLSKIFSENSFLPKHPPGPFKLKFSDKFCNFRVFKDTVKAFNDFKSKQQKCMMSCFLICKSMYILKVYSIHCTLRYVKKISNVKKISFG